MVCGTGMTKLLRGYPRRGVRTKYGNVSVFEGRSLLFLPRHGPKGETPPHRINHRANLLALKELGAEEVVGVSSVGSLRQEIEPGSFVIPHDYVSLWRVDTFYDHKAVHITPKLDEGLRKRLIEACRRGGVRCVDHGVYVQTLGPRLETKAEVRFLQSLGDVVGMTMASEATLARELGLRYAAICCVDNYAHGLGEELDFRLIVEEAEKRREVVLRILEALSTSQG